ncbi:integrase_H2C2 domain-containing protein [Trichonephila clavipes]|nr:integrase_H2C2 domain-containing protein [Trichonephila clavipes]
MEKFEGVTDEKLRPLKPFLDEFGILHARTKLSFREDTDNFKFSIILPNEHPVVHLMIVRKHEELMHAGVSIVMNHLRESFWILKARKLIRQIIQKCTRCKRFSAQKTEVVPSSCVSSALIATSKRFFGRRGRSSTIFINNATSFVGASTELKKPEKLVSKSEDISNFLASEGTKWNFLPHRGPKFGGLWKTGVVF